MPVAYATSSDTLQTDMPVSKVAYAIFFKRTVCYFLLACKLHMPLLKLTFQIPLFAPAAAAVFPSADQNTEHIVL